MSQHKWLVKHPEVEEAIDLGFYRPIGYAVSRLLRLTPVTPDQVTLAAAVVGVCAGHLFLYGLPLLDVAGGCALVFSALLDSVDGQLARLRATSSGKGRVYDGFSDSAVFISVYVHLAARLVWQGCHPGLFLLALLALASQFTANVMADLYRNSYLRFALLDAGAEGESLREVREMRSRARDAGVVERVLLFFYLRIARQQEGWNPQLTILRVALARSPDRQAGAGVPDRQAVAARYRELFQPLVPQLAWLGTNVRVLLLLALLPVGAIRTFFWVNVTVLNLALALLVRAHERRARTLLGELRAAEAGEPRALSVHVLVFAEPAEAEPTLLGVPVLERLLRTLVRSGVTHAVLLSSAPEALGVGLAGDDWARAGLAVSTRSRSAGVPQVADALAAWPEQAERVLVFPSLGVFDARLVKALVRASDAAALVDSSTEEPSMAGPSIARTSRGLLCGPALLERSFLASRRGDLAIVLAEAIDEGALGVVDVREIPRYIPSMRRTLRPFWLPAPTGALGLNRAEAIVVEAAQKKALDFPAYVHAPIENAVVRAICRTGVTPNQVSLLGNVVAWIGTALLATGQLGWGILLALVVGVLDGVDGKLARMKIETTPSGKLEHWFDTFFEVSWAVALAWHLARSGARPDAWWLLLLLLGAEAVDGLAKGAIILRYGRQIDDVAPFDRAVRLVGGRRNVYVWIMAVGIALGAAANAFALVACWEALTALVHVGRVAWLVGRRVPVAAD